MSEQKKRLHMAHNIYSNPVLNGTGRKFDGFSIDFRGIQTPRATYWAVCNWGMNLSGFRTEHPDAKGGGAYAGMQNTCNGKTAIMAFWEIFYEGESKRHNARRVYPAGKDNTFGGEGEGTNYITPFGWEDNCWYRMILRSWVDAEKGTTFVGQWICNRETGSWSLISCFDTGLKDSFLEGGMSQFQENYWDEDSEPIREFHLKNIYVLDHTEKKWKYIERTALSYDDPAWHFNTAGTHNFGATTEYFFGSAGGDVENAKEYDAVRPLSSVYAVEKKEELFGGEKELLPKKEQKNGRSYLCFEGGNTACPVMLCAYTVLDNTGKTVAKKEVSLPTIREIELPEGSRFLCKLVDVYGRERDYELQL